MTLKNSVSKSKQRFGKAGSITLWTATTALSAVAAARLSPAPHKYLIATQGCAAFGLASAAPLAACAARFRHPSAVPLTALALFGGVLYRRAGGHNRRELRPAGGTLLTVTTANLWDQNKLSQKLGNELSDTGSDLVVVEEFTPAHAAGFARSRLASTHPFHVLDATSGPHGSAIYSKRPIRGTSRSVGGVAMVFAEVDTNSGPVAVVAVHANNPATREDRNIWKRQISELVKFASESSIPVVLAGDWNATLDHKPLRVALSSGLRDAFSVAGKGWGATWPNYPGGKLRPLMRIDHVLVSPGIRVVSARHEPSIGSDHLRLIVELGLPPKN